MAPDEGGALQHAGLVQQHPVGAVRDLAVRALAPHRQLAFGAVGQDEKECVRPRKRLDEHRLAEPAHKRLRTGEESSDAASAMTTPRSKSECASAVPAA